MKSVIVRLREYREHASVVEEPVLRFVLGNPDLVTDMTIHQLAAQCFASSATIVRMLKKLEFGGYKEFKKALIYEMAIRQQNAANEEKEITKFDSIQEIAEKITYKNIVSLEDTKNLLDIGTIEKCVDLLCSCKSIVLFGIGASLLVAKDAHLKFMRINKPCFINDDWHSQQLQARNMSKDDVGIVFSYSGRTVEMITCERAMREVGASIISITRYDVNPVSQLSDYRLYVSSNESIFRSGAMGSRISILNIIDILYTAFANREYDYCIKQLSRTHIQKPEQ